MTKTNNQFTHSLDNWGQAEPLRFSLEVIPDWILEDYLVLKESYPASRKSSLRTLFRIKPK